MTVKEAIEKWSEACSVCKSGEALVRDGNWTPTTRVLRHYIAKESATIEVKGGLNGDVVVLVKPIEPKEPPPVGKSLAKREPFLLVVK
jgi:hypothetical protein